MPALTGKSTTNPEDRNEWRTPPVIFNLLNREFHFTVDAAATAENTLLPRFWTKETDGLAQSWRGERIFCNPPYGRGPAAYPKWLDRAVRERDYDVYVFLIPGDTSGRVWVRSIWGQANEVRFLVPRISYLDPQNIPMGRPNFGSAVVIFKTDPPGITYPWGWQWMDAAFRVPLAVV